MTGPEREAFLSEVREREQKAIRGPWDTEYDSCDCGDGYGCGHGYWVYALRLPEPRHEEFSDGKPIPVNDYHYSYSEFSELPVDTAEFIAYSREDVTRLLAIIDELQMELAECGEVAADIANEVSA